MDRFDIYRTILKNENVKKEFQEYVRIIVRTIADESYIYIYLALCFIFLNFLILLLILGILVLRR